MWLRGVCVVSCQWQGHESEFWIPPYHPHTTFVLLMASQTVEIWSRQLLEPGYPVALAVAFVSAGATERQRVVVTGVSGAATDARVAVLPSPTLAVIGQVVSLRARLAWFEPLRNASRAGPVEYAESSETVAVGAGAHYTPLAVLR